MEFIDLTSDASDNDDEPLSVRAQVSKRPRLEGKTPGASTALAEDDEVEEIEPVGRELHHVGDPVNESDDVAITGEIGQVCNSEVARHWTT